MYDDMKTVSGAITVLFVALVFVYLVFFAVHGKELQPYPTLEQLALGTSGSVSSGDSVLSDFLGIQDPELAPQDTENNEEDTVVQDFGIQIQEAVADQPADVRVETDTLIRPEPQPNITFYSVEELFKQDNVATPDNLSLSGTHNRKGFMKTLGILGLENDAKYILKNNLNTHFVFLDTFDKSLESKVLSLGGNMVEIADETAINHHRLFGDKITFINLPAYENIKVLMLVWFEDQNDTRFLQVDYDTYYDQKADLQQTMGQFYTW